MNALPARPQWLRWSLSLLGVALLLSFLALDWNLEVFGSADAFAAALQRLGSFLASLRAPDLSHAMLARASELAIETLAVALLGVALGLLLAWPLAMGAAGAVLLGSDRHRGPARWWRLGLLQVCRLVLDVLRGVPDFVWALVISIVSGPTAITGMLAIAVSVAGILGKVISEQWDNVDPVQYAALRSTGAGNLQVFLYGIQPLSARSVLSFVLMRTECAVRNASVIGVVGGGGLGAALWDEYTNLDRNVGLARMATVLLFMLALTASTDVAANMLRYQLRVDPNHPRTPRTLTVRTSTLRRGLGVGAVLLLLATLAWQLRPAFLRAFEEPPSWGYVWNYCRDLATPNLAPAMLWSAVRESAVPLSVACIATCVSVGLAGLLSYPGSVAFQLDAPRFSGEAVPPLVRGLRWLSLLLARGLALLMRGIPEVAWVFVLGVFLRSGIAPCVLAVILHSTGVLTRVFTETVDNVPYRRLEQVYGGSRAQTFLYGAVPSAWPDWKTYAFFQFEVNVRIGVVLGWVGAGGLGDKFDSNRQWMRLHDASTYLWAMILLTVLIDRTSRWLQLRRLRC